jgi:hypothetical protein
MDTANSIFKFVTIRNASTDVKSEPKFEIQPKTEFVNSLVAILSNDQKQPEKIKSFNKSLDDFMKTKNFYKTKQEVETGTKLIKAKYDKKNTAEFNALYKNIYNNIVLRTATKSNENEIFQILTNSLKLIFQKINAENIKVEDIPKLKIILPDGLIFSFSPPRSVDTPVIDIVATERAATLSKINALTTQKEAILKQKSDNTTQIRVEQKKITELENEFIKTQIPHTGIPSGQTGQENVSSKTQKKVSPVNNPTIDQISMVEINRLYEVEKTLEASESIINLELTRLNNQALKLIPTTKYAYIGENYVDVTNLRVKPPVTKVNDEIIVYSNGCYLKFPFQVADLRVVEQKTVAYMPSEIAHINNTQSGEKQEKVTRRLKRIETFDSLISEDEVTKETDTQSTEKFSLEKAASDVQSEENAVNVNASVSGTYGVVTASLDAGFSHSDSSVNSNSSSQNYAKEIVQRVVDRVSHKVKSERSIKSIEEFEETVTHIIDNSGENDKGPKSYVYRWLTKLVRATLKNYGKRLIFQIDVAHPSHYYLTRIITEKPSLNIPADPRTLDGFTIDKIDETNYLAWAEKYHAKPEQPPISKLIIGISEVKDQTLTIPDGYLADRVYVNKALFEDSNGWANLVILIGRTNQSVWINPSDPGISIMLVTNNLNQEGQLPIAFTSTANGDRKVAIEVECVLSPRALREWKIKCYQVIIDAYENLKAEAESKMSDFNPNNPGLNPDRKTELIRTELKKGALTKMFRCNPFWITDNYHVGREYDPNCCEDTLNAEKIRFLETTFDWKNMTYELYPYFYADKDNWKDLLDLTDDDPHFETFLQSSYATLRIPVYRDSEKEIAAINFILNNSIANHSVVPANMQHIIDDLNTITPFGFINETETTIPFVDIKKEYDKTGKIKIYYIDDLGNEILCEDVLEYDKEGNKTVFYYTLTGSQMVISEIKEGINSEGQKYNYYFNSANEKIITHKSKTEYDLTGNSIPYYSTDLGIFPIPTDLVILEAGVQAGVEIRGYPEDTAAPTSEVIIPKQYSPAIIQK